MHGTYEHRINCSLHPHQYHPLVEAAKKAGMSTTVFVRDAALAYVQKKTVLPPGLGAKIKSKQQEIESAALYLKPIVAQVDASQRLTPRDSKRAAKIAKYVDRQVRDLLSLISLIPHDDH